MFRVIDYEVPPLSAPVRISIFLRRKGFSRQNLIELKKQEGSVLVNGSARFFNERVSGGEIMTVRIPLDADPERKVVPVALPVEIIYEDPDLLVVNKRAGMPTHPSFRNRDNTLANAMAWYFREKGEPFVFRCSNRLDRDTSGLTVIARHFVSGNMLSVMGTDRLISREYLGIVHGVPSPPEGVISAPLARMEGSILQRQVDFEHGESAVTHYRTVLTNQNGYSLISLRLESGRTHQIRVHMQYIGCPLIGDYLYNPDMEIMHRQALHCASLSFPHPITGRRMTFHAPLPEDMQWILADQSFLPPAP